MRLHIAVVGPMSIDLLPPTGLEPDALPGYPAPIVSMIVNGYLKRGHRVTAVTTCASVSDALVLSDGTRFTLVVVPRTGPRSALRLFNTERKHIREALDKARPDVVHAHWTYEFGAGALDSGFPTLITVRDRAWRILCETARDISSPREWLARVGYRALRACLSTMTSRRATALSCPSEYMRDNLPRSVRKRTLVIPNFISPEALPLPVPTTARDRRIVTVSNGFSGWKNVACGILAFAQSGLGARGWTYELIGDQLGPGEPAELWAKARGLSAGVRFTGRLSYAETIARISTARVLVHTSREESFGMTVLEAMAVGVPVIGGERAGNVSTLLADDCGLLCDITRPDELAERLSWLAANEEAQQRIGELARARVQEEYCPDTVIDAYISYLMELVARKDGR